MFGIKKPKPIGRVLMQTAVNEATGGITTEPAFEGVAGTFRKAFKTRFYNDLLLIVLLVVVAALAQYGGFASSGDRSIFILAAGATVALLLLFKPAVMYAESKRSSEVAPSDYYLHDN